MELLKERKGWQTDTRVDSKLLNDWKGWPTSRSNWIWIGLCGCEASDAKLRGRRKRTGGNRRHTPLSWNPAAQRWTGSFVPKHLLGWTYACVDGARLVNNEARMTAGAHPSKSTVVGDYDSLRFRSQWTALHLHRDLTAMVRTSVQANITTAVSWTVCTAVCIWRKCGRTGRTLELFCACGEIAACG